MYPEHQKLLLQRQEHLLAELAERSKEGFQKAQEEHERNVRLWQQRQDKAKGGEGAGAGTGTTSAEGTPAPGSGTPSVNGGALPQLPHERDDTNDSGAGIDGDGPPPSQAAGDKQSGEHPPTKRYRLTERIRHIIWELVVLSNESCRIENEKKCVVFFILCCEVPWN